MKTISLLAAAGLSIMTTSSASAKEFSGFRAEVHAGLDILKNTLDSQGEQTFDDPNTLDEPITLPFSANEKFSRSGLVYGAAVGYDFPISGESLFLGLEASASLSTVKARLSDEKKTHDIDKSKPKRELSISTRIGHKVGDDTLAYVKVGYVNGRFVTSGFPLRGLNNQEYDYPLGYKEARNLSGYRIGAGAERKLAANAYIKVDYSFTEFKGTSRNFDGIFLGMPWKHNIDMDTRRHQVTIGLGTRL